MISASHSLPSQRGAIRRKDNQFSLTLSRVGEIRLSGGNAYSNMFCHGCGSVSTPNGAYSSLREKDSRHFAFACEAKRSTMALPYILQI